MYTKTVAYIAAILPENLVYKIFDVALVEN